MQMQPLTRMEAGCVYCVPEGYRIVVASDGRRALVAVIKRRWSESCRGDYPLSDWDVATLGLPAGKWLVRVDGAKLEPVGSVAAIGTLSAATVRKIATGAERAALARHLEDRAAIRMEI